MKYCLYSRPGTCFTLTATGSIPEIVIQISRRLPTHITSCDSSVTPKPVTGNCHFPSGSLSPCFDADVAGNDARLANGDIVDDCCGV
jgi:hypothetical protein